MPINSETMHEVGNELLSDAKGVGSTAINRLHSEIDSRKSDAVSQVQTVSSTIEQAAVNLDSNAPAWIKSALEQGAEHVRSFADTLDHNDSRQIVNQISQFAKNSPGTFLGACAAVGFASARILKAGSNNNSPTQLGEVSPVMPEQAAPYASFDAGSTSRDLL